MFALTLAGCVIIAVAALFASRLPLSRDRELLAQLRQDGDVIVAALAKFQAIHGKYPNFMDQLSDTEKLPTIRMWGYHVSMDALECGISAGKYFRDGFVLSWHSKIGRWHLDD